MPAAGVSDTDLPRIREQVGAILARREARAYLREVTLEGGTLTLSFAGEVSDEVEREIIALFGIGVGLAATPSPSVAVTSAPRSTATPAAATPTQTAPSSPIAPAASPLVDDAIALAAIRRVLPAVVHLRTGTMPNGTGFVVSADGHVLTNAHVAKEMGPESVALFHDGRRVPARVVGYVESAKPDIAVVKVEATGLIPVEFADAAPLGPGEPLLQIGHPQGFGFWLVTGGTLIRHHKVTKYPSRDLTVEYRELEADIPGASGSSGSPYLNRAGQVVGILYGSIEGSVGEPRPGPFHIVWTWDEFFARRPQGSTGVASEDARQKMAEILAAKGNVP